MLLASKAVTLNLENTVGRASLDLATLGFRSAFRDVAQGPVRSLAIQFAQVKAGALKSG